MGIFDLQTWAPGSSYLSPEQQQSASTMGWLNAAQALANASAPHPLSQGQPTMLQLLAGGAQAYSKGTNEYTDMLADQYKKMSDMKRSQDMEKYISGMTPEQRSAMGVPEGMPMTPEMIAAAAKANMEGASKLKWEPQVAGLTEAAKNPALIARAGGEEAAKTPYMMQRDAYGKNLDLRNQFAFDQGKIREVAPGATLVGPRVGGGLSDFYKNPNPAPGTQEGGIDKWYAEKFTGIQDAAIQSQSLLQNMKTMDNLLSGIETGKYGNTALDIKKAASRAGIALDLPDNLGKQEAAQSIARQMALQLRNPANGAGMPGAMSDADRMYLESMTPGLETTEPGRKQIINAQEKLTQRSNEVAKMARDYRAKNNNKLDDGFIQELQDYSANNPLFTKGPEGIQIDGKAPGIKVYNPKTGRIE